MLTDALILDPYSGLSHKAIFAGSRPDGTGSRTGLAPTWVGDNARRLDAYKILTAYALNVARFMLSTGTAAELDSHREYGDPGLIVVQVRAALLADMRITVEGAEGEPPPRPVDLPDGASTEETTEWEARVKAWEQTMTERGPSLELQDWFDGWAKAEKFARKIIHNEDNAVGLGDGVIAAVWSGSRSRPTLRVFDPGFFFPVLDPLSDDDDFPQRVHLAWEYDDVNPDAVHPETAPKVRWVRRITYELIDLADPQVAPERRAAILSTLPWETQGPEDTAGEGTKVSTKRCFMSDGVWKLDQVAGPNVNDPDRLPRSKARWLPDPDDPGQVLDHKPLGIDFLPVVHVPNTIPGDDFWGTATLTQVAQLLDDIANSDSDEQAASAIVGTPPLVVSGASDRSGTIGGYGPGTVFFTDADGKIGYLDTSKSLDAIAGHIERLLKRLSVNARVPAEILGRVNASEVPSGVAMALAFGPFQSLIEDMRLIRSEKYALLLKFVARLAQLAGPANGGLQPGPLPEVSLTFGSYLPSDLNGIVTLLLTAMEGHGLSRATFLRLAAQAGLEIDDLVDEEARIRGEDFPGAQVLADATGDENLAREYLGFDAVEPPPAPPIQIVAGAAAANVAAGNPVGGGVPGAAPPPGPGAPTPPPPPGQGGQPSG